MKKTIIIVLVLIVIGAIAYMFFGDTGTVEIPETHEEVTEQTDREVRGTVLSVNTDHVPVDGPTLVSVTTASGVAVIAIPSMGINFCAAQANITSLQELKVGDTIEAKGQVGVDGIIIPCESATHYLRVVQE